MKTLHTNAVLIFSTVLFSSPDVFLIMFAIYSFMDGEIGDSIHFIILSIVFVAIGLYGGLRIYCTHWIRYGDGKVVIRRVSIKRVNGRAVGVWENREDEFLLNEIEVYGLSREVLGHSVEFHRSSRGRLETEFFFQLKNGKQIGFELGYYMGKDIKKFIRYIYEQTGIEFQGKLEKWK